MPARTAFLRGLAVHLANPKAVLFFVPSIAAGYVRMRQGAVAMQRGSFGYFASALATLYPSQSTDAGRIEAEFGHTLFVHFTRMDKLDQAISRV